MKIRTIQRNFGTPVEMNPRTTEHIMYIQGNRRRSEERRVQRNALWPGGPRVSFYEPHGALIETCEGDTKKAFSLDLDSRTYAPITLRQKIDAKQANALRDRAPKVETPMRPTVLHEITTRDTGECKEAFGYTARHVITTHTVTPVEGTEVIPQETITDGWYIDLDTRISCDPEDRTPSEGTTYGAYRLTVGALKSGDNVSASPPSLVQMTYVGKPEKGFPIWVKRTARRGEQVTTSENEVTELSTKSLDPSLFEVPRNFRRVERNLPWPRPPLWARWLAWAHSVWVRGTPARLMFLIVLIAIQAAAYDHPLGSHAIREAYFIGSGGEQLLGPYTQNLPVPKTGAHVAQIEVRTPFRQVIEMSREHSVGYSAQSAEQNYKKHPDTVQVRVQILNTATFSIASPLTPPVFSGRVLQGPCESELLRMYSVEECFRDFRFRFSQEKEIKAKSSYGLSIHSGDSVLIGGDVWFVFSTSDIASAPFLVTVSTPDGQTVSAEFDLASLR